jgi:hypothetical protein
MAVPNECLLLALADTLADLDIGTEWAELFVWNGAKGKAIWTTAYYRLRDLMKKELEVVFTEPGISNHPRNWQSKTLSKRFLSSFGSIRTTTGVRSFLVLLPAQQQDTVSS